MSGTLSRPGKGHPGTEETDGLAPYIQNKDKILFFGSRTGIKVRLFYRSAFLFRKKLKSRPTPFQAVLRFYSSECLFTDFPRLMPVSFRSAFLFRKKLKSRPTPFQAVLRFYSSECLFTVFPCLMPVSFRCRLMRNAVCLRAASLPRFLNEESGSVPRFPPDKLRLCFDGAPEVSKIYGAEAFVTLLRTGHGF